ncbi:hypothetical protein BX616_009708 [Lobosporangium transversale]|nr:hypothetical protein BX616_009708 [Lobosporangium transversale]
MLLGEELPIFKSHWLSMRIKMSSNFQLYTELIAKINHTETLLKRVPKGETREAIKVALASAKGSVKGKSRVHILISQYHLDNLNRLISEAISKGLQSATN